MNPAFFIIFSLIFTSHLESSPPANKITAVYHSLDPFSLSQHLAFYELYPETPEGKKALQDAWNLLSNCLNLRQNNASPLPALPTTIETLISIVNKEPDKQTLCLTETQLKGIENIGSSFPNRLLKGHEAKTEAEVLTLPPEEIDLARGLLLSQLADTPDNLNLIRSYEASLDLMAMQILTRISAKADPKVKIRALNQFIFEEMGYRFPPHSVYAKDIDLYTYLPSVLDSRHGICLGVSILYICLAQRIGLPLEMITPPGHIYVRYRNGEEVVNIETTARGIHLDSEEYLGVETRSLEQRNIKEVIGMAHYNHAALHWHHKDYAKALASYQRALPYLPDDFLLKELMGYNHLFIGNQKEGEAFLEKVKDHLPDHAVSKQNIAEDYLNKAVDSEGIQALFMQVDENRNSILEKKEALEKIIQKYPRFRGGLFSLAGVWLQLHRAAEALDLLERYHALDKTDPSVEYYLATLYAERLDYNKAWEHLRIAEKIVQTRRHEPKALKQLRKELSRLCPE